MAVTRNPICCGRLVEDSGAEDDGAARHLDGRVAVPDVPLAGD